LAKVLGKMGKSTARMHRMVMIIMCARYTVTNGLENMRHGSGGRRALFFSEGDAGRRTPGEAKASLSALGVGWCVLRDENVEGELYGKTTRSTTRRAPSAILNVRAWCEKIVRTRRMGRMRTTYSRSNGFGGPDAIRGGIPDQNA
jgi:hypothetical protein